MRRRIRYLYIVMLMIALCGCASSKDTIIRDVNWESTYNEIAEMEKEKGSEVSLYDDFLCAEVENAWLYGMIADTIYYSFDGDTLSEILIFYDADEEYAKREDEFAKLKEELTSVFGEPIEEGTIVAGWSKEGFIIKLDEFGDQHRIQFLKQ